MSLQAFLNARTEPSAPSCQSCGTKPYVICKMLDPRKGETIRIFKCECGAMTTSASSVQGQFD
jgi:hypothetical protein